MTLKKWAYSNGNKKRIMSIKNDKNEKESWWTREWQQQHRFSYIHESPTPQAALNRTTSLASGKESQRPPGHIQDHMWWQLALCFPKPRSLRHTWDDNTEVISTGRGDSVKHLFTSSEPKDMTVMVKTHQKERESWAEQQNWPPNLWVTEGFCRNS